jgi:DNA-binding NarL/FixJ family response regulator
MRGTAGVLPAQHPEPVGSLNTPGDPTAREHQVLELIAQDLDNSTIGLRLGISERTARNHVSVIFSELGVKSAPKPSCAREARFGRKADR